MSFMRNVSELRENPLSLAIYGAEEDIADLVESVREHGILTPLLVREDGTIISGHRRFRAARQLGYEAVPCELIAFSSQEEEEIVLIAANKSRQKTAVQLLREGERMKEAVAAQMKKRQLSGLKWNSNCEENSTATVGTNMGPTVGGSGSKGKRVKATNIISDALGLSRTSWLRLDSVSRAAKAGSPVAVEALLQLNQGKITINRALSMVKKSLRVQDAKGEREITFGEESLKNAKNYLEALSGILRAVLDSQEEFDYMQWLMFCEGLKGLADTESELSKKMDAMMKKEIEESLKVLKEGSEATAAVTPAA